MRLSEYLDMGASLDPSAPCLTMVGKTRSYHDVQRLSWLVGRALARSGIGPGDKIVVLSDNDAVAFSCVFGIARAGAVWCIVDAHNEPGRTLRILDDIDCSCLIFQDAFAPLVRRIARELPKVRLLVSVDQDPGLPPDPPAAIPLRTWLAGLADVPFAADQQSDVAAIMGARTDLSDAKGVLLTCDNIQAMAEATLTGYPFTGRPVFLAITPLTRGLAMFAFPVMCLGGELVLLSEFSVADLLAAISQHRVTHVFLPSSLLGVLLDHPDLACADLSSLQCVWYDGGDAIPVGRLEDAIKLLGPVMAELFAQPEVLMTSGLGAPDLIATGRFNVYSAEVEQALTRHPAVRSCAVMTAPNAPFSAGVTAVVQPVPGFRLATAEARAYLRGRIGRHAPRSVQIWSNSGTAGRGRRLGRVFRHGSIRRTAS